MDTQTLKTNTDLRQIVERVVVDSSGNAKLELWTPFAYLHDISDQIRNSSMEFENAPTNIKTVVSDGLDEPECSTQVLLFGEDWTAIEQSTQSTTSEFLYKLAFPQRDRVSRFSTHHS